MAFIVTVYSIAVLLGGFLGIGGLLYISFETADQSYNDAQEITVTVTACQMQQQEGYDKRPGVTYTYRVLDVPYTNQGELEGVSCDDYPTGTSLNALYDASNPSDASVVQTNASEQTYVIQGVVAFVLCVIAGIVTYREIRRSFYAIRNRYYRLDYGTLLDGEITSISGYTLSKTDEYYVRIRYRFVAPNKKVVTGYTEAHREDLRDNMPSVGTPVKVLYDFKEHIML